MSIDEWLTGRDTGASSRTLALAALRQPIDRLDYPHDADDFGRCYRLLQQCPQARAGLEALAKSDCPVWRALAARWDELSDLYQRDQARGKIGRRSECAALIRAIITPVERASGRVLHGRGWKIIA